MVNKNAVPTGSPLTDFQRRMLGHMKRGCGLDARPSQYTKKELREMEDLVTRGLARKAKNYRKDKVGMYLANQ